MDIKPAWNEADFVAWMSRNGLTAAAAAEVLYLTATSVKRIRNGSQAILIRTQALAEDFEMRRTVVDPELDSQADVADVADTCRDIEFSVITGMTSAALRGWTTASTHVRFVALPPRPAKLRLPAGVFAVADRHLPRRVELHSDSSGRWFRLADPVRTVVDAVRDVDRQVAFHVEEVVRSAIDAGVKPDDLVRHAALYGSAVEADLQRWLAGIAA